MKAHPPLCSFANEAIMRALSLFALAPLARASPTIATQHHLAVQAGGDVSVSYRLDTPTPSTCVFATPGSPPATTPPSAVRHYYNSSYFHHVDLSGLAPGAAYTYTCPGAAPRAFTAPPAPGATGWSFATLGDWGWLGSAERGPSIPTGGLAQNWSAVPVRQLLGQLVASKAVSMVMHNGDVGYWDDSFGIDGDLLKFTQEAATDGWFQWIENISQSVPYMVAAGK